MEYKNLEVTLISAKDLKDVNLFGKMDVYAVATLSNDPRSKQRTPVDKDGGRNPTWNFPMKFYVPTSSSSSSSLLLHIQFKSDRSFGLDRDIGEVHIPIKELLSSASSDAKANNFVSYQVRKASGKPKGLVNLSFKFGDKVTPPPPPEPSSHKSDEPVTAYPAPGPSSAGVYPPPGAYPYPPPPQQGYGYPPPPPQQPYGYGYPPQPPPPQHGYGYGYPPQAGAVPPQRPKKNNFGLGLGAGLLGGALGGLLIGDMISDSSNAYDAGYDAGFDDGGGFDF